MEGQQPGGGEAGGPGRLRRPGAAPRSRLPARRPPAGEAAKPPDDYRESNQEIWNPPPRLRHSGRYSRECAQLRSSPHSCLLQIGLGFVFLFVCFSVQGPNFTVCCIRNSKKYCHFLLWISAFWLSNTKAALLLCAQKKKKNTNKSERKFHGFLVV